MHHTASIIIQVFVLTAGSIMASFALRMMDTDKEGDLPPTAVVFTGQFDRITRGLDLLKSGQVQRLFISGVNAEAGLNPQTFAQQFKFPPALEEGLTTGRIMLATEAQDTIENALETSCWLARFPGSRRVLLVTSQLHMPRGSLALERASGVLVKRLVIGPAYLNAWDLLTAEFWKYAGTWFVTLFPTRMWPARSGFACASS
jgi:uncharacterized SAM-binding protein YcdF (DUF218 family)